METTAFKKLIILVLAFCLALYLSLLCLYCFKNTCKTIKKARVENKQGLHAFLLDSIN